MLSANANGFAHGAKSVKAHNICQKFTEQMLKCIKSIPLTSMEIIVETTICYCTVDPSFSRWQKFHFISMSKVARSLYTLFIFHLILIAIFFCLRLSRGRILYQKIVNFTTMVINAFIMSDISHLSCAGTEVAFRDAIPLPPTSKKIS